MSFNNPTHNQNLFIFQFCDTGNLVNFSKKLTNLFQFTRKEHIYPQKIPIFWVIKNNKIYWEKKLTAHNWLGEKRWSDDLIREMSVPVTI
jgi:hypothetical protein